MVQLVKNPSTVGETYVQSLCWEDPLEKGKATHSSILAWRIPWTIQSMGVAKSWTRFIGRTDAEVEAPILWPPDVNSGLIGKDSDAWKD